MGLCEVALTWSREEGEKREGEKKKGGGGKKSQRGNNSCSRPANLPVPCVARSVIGACVVGVKYSALCLLKAGPL